MSNKSLGLSQSLHDYVLAANPPEHPCLQAIREQTEELGNAVMISSREQVQFLMFLIHCTKPKKLLEIGTFTGYTSLAMALAAPTASKVITCDIDQRWPSLGLPHWQTARMQDKIELKLGPALATLQTLKNEHQVFDFIYIDADKANYINYFEQTQALLSDHGIIAIDNVLWSGKVAETSATNDRTQAIRALNQHIAQHCKLYSLLPIGDGLMLYAKS